MASISGRVSTNRAARNSASRRDGSARLRQIRAFLASRPETADGEFTLPVVTGVLRTQLLREDQCGWRT
jgi:hypothetical protein